MSQEKMLKLKSKLKELGFQESFTKENYNLISHIIIEYQNLKEKNILSEKEMALLRRQIKALSDIDMINTKLSSQIKILNETKKNLLNKIKELNDELEEKNIDIKIMKLNENKNKDFIENIKKEKNDLGENLEKYRKKITELNNQINILKQEKEKNINLESQNNDYNDKIKILEENNNNKLKEIKKLEE